MKRMILGSRGLVAALSCMACGMAGAADFKIQSFDGTGQLTFNEISTATVYRVEWAPTPSGPWTNFTGAAGAQLDMIQATGSGIVTCSVPMCYRVVATVTNALPETFSDMVLVKGGSLTNIGNGAIMVSSFSIGKYEVTWAQWQAVRDWAATNDYDIGSVGAGSAANHPVNSVSWYECVKWCNARSQKEGLTPVYYTDAGLALVYKTINAYPFVNASATGYRLPTDAEWEFTARGGTQSQGYEYSGGNDLNVVGWYSDNSGGGDKAVGQKTANELGLYDMSGNVYEWCFDWYPGQEGSYRVGRGGTWHYDANFCRSAFRLLGNPRNRSLYIGFRLAQTLP